MKYRIIREKDNKYWHSAKGWNDSAEWFNDDDIDVLLPHFKSHGINCAAIPEGSEFKAWHLTGSAIIE